MKDGCPADYSSTNLPADSTTDPLIYLSLSKYPQFNPILPPSIIHSVKSLSNHEHKDRRQSMQDQRVLCPSQGGGFGAGVVKASEAHVMQCENGQCEWKHSAEAKPHWETQRVVDVTLEGDSENLPIPTSNTRTCTDQHERDQLAPNLHAHNQRVTKKMSTRCIGGHRFALHMSHNRMENPKSCTVPSHGPLNCR